MAQPILIPRKPMEDYHWYMSIGNGGHRYVSRNGLVWPEPVKRAAGEVSMLEQLPFHMCGLDADIDEVTQRRYGDRRVEVHDGQTYVAYYLWRMKPLLGVSKKELLFQIDPEDWRNFLNVCKIRKLKPENSLISEMSISWAERVDHPTVFTPFLWTAALYSSEQCLTEGIGIQLKVTEPD